MILVNILLIEADSKNAQLIKHGLKKKEFQIYHANNMEEGSLVAQNPKFGMIVIDIQNSSSEAIKLISTLRNQGNHTPILLLSPQQFVEELVPLLNNSETDFVLKPVTVVELRARMNTLLRRSLEQSESHKLSTAGVVLDLVNREVYRGEERIPLQKNEFELLEFFMRNAGNVVTKSDILKKIWDYNFDPQTNVVDVLVWRLRAKIDRHFPNKVIQTVRGVGYIFRPI